MEKHLLTVLLTLISLSCLAQNTFEKGYFIDDANQKVNCLIKSIDWINNPTEFSYKLSEEAELKVETTKTVKEFGVHNVSKYISAKVNMDRSSELLDELSYFRKPEFNEEELFLKVLVEGSATLYQYIENSLTRYFYKTADSEIEQLVFKTYKKHIIKSLRIIISNSSC